MLTALLGALLVSSPVALLVDQIDRGGEAVLASFERALAEHVPEVTIERRKSPCTSLHECILSTKQRTGAREVILLRVYRAPTRFRAVVRPFPDSYDRRGREVVVDLAHVDPGDWSEKLREIAREAASQLLLGPAPPPPPPLERVIASHATEVAPARSDGGLRIAAFCLLGAAVAAAGVTVGFSLSASAAQDDLRAREVSQDRIPSTVSRARTHSTVADVALGVAVGAAAGAVALFVW